MGWNVTTLWQTTTVVTQVKLISSLGYAFSYIKFKKKKKKRMCHKVPVRFTLINTHSSIIAMYLLS